MQTRVVPFERRHGEFVITTDRARLDVAAIHAYLSHDAYWCLGIPRETVERAIDHSVNFGVLDGTRQIAFARVVTDWATFGWVCDVYVLPEYRGKGIARAMLQAMLDHPELQGLRRWVLATRDAHDLYRRVGFIDLPNPERWMVIENRRVYSSNARAR